MEEYEQREEQCRSRHLGVVEVDVHRVHVEMDAAAAAAAAEEVVEEEEELRVVLVICNERD